MDFGKVRYFTHSSKTNCVFVDNQDSPLISINIWCKAGVSFEDNRKEGIAHFLEHMIFKGSNELMPGEFDYKIESLGGSSNASTGYDDAHYYVLIPPTNFIESLSLLTNLILFPEIDIKEFELEKGVIIEEINQQNDQPDEKLLNYFLKRVWESHSYGKSILGTKKKITSLNKNDIETFHSKQYSFKNTCIAIAGKLPKGIEKIIDNLEIKYKSQNNHIEKNNFQSKYRIRTGREEINLSNIEMSRILIAWQIPPAKEQRIILGFEVLATILSEGRNSKLVRPIKEELNLVESVYADINSGEYGGIFIIEACSIQENIKLVEDKINLVINEITSTNNIGKNDLIKALNIVRSNFIFNLETPSQLAAYFGNNLLWGRKNPIDKFEQNLDYWNDIENFKEIISYLSKDRFTLIANKI